MPPLRLILLLCFLSCGQIHGKRLWDFNSPNAEWDGRWFPFAPDDKDRNPVVELGHNHLYDANHGVAMGVPDPDCDDGKTNLDMDWDMNPANHTCFDFDNKIKFTPRSNVHPVLSVQHIPKHYSARHYCMNHSITYEEILPTFGPHRPLWAKYGQYVFLPRQRWLHNLEHGAIVMLYHPCANKNEVKLLKSLVAKCLYRHIITPYNLLTPKYPLALLSWGKRLHMSKVAPDLVIGFIKQNALKGPEQAARDGQYSLLLEKHAEIVSDIKDSKLCNNLDFIN